MRNIINIALKELKSYFISPIAYVIASVFLVITGYQFYTAISQFSLYCFKMMNYSQAVENININLQVFQGNFGSLLTTIMFIMPIMTMRIFAEEKKNRTMELLMTSPVSVFEIVLGKFLAAFILLSGIVLLTLYMPIFASYNMNTGRLLWAPIVSGYIGILMLGSVFLSIGILASALTENQIVAALISFAFIIIFLLIDKLAQLAEGTLAKVLSYLSLSNHIRNFFFGVIDTRSVILYISFILFGLFMTFRVIESKRWA